jgi:hypothetical protein
LTSTNKGDTMRFVAGILRCDLCQDEHRAIMEKLGHLWIAKGQECAACGAMACVVDEAQHFATEDEAMAYVSDLPVNEAPTPPLAG